jgi:hypothetical protein
MKWPAQVRTKSCMVKRNTDVEATILGKFVVMSPLLDERARRLWAAAESAAIGYGGTASCPRATGLARETIRKGRRELARGLWKWELQRLANRTGLAITVCHFPPGTSKWNKIEHRLFSHIAMNWRGKPLVSLAAIVSLIASTHNRSGLRVRSEIDRTRYGDAVTVIDAQMATVHLERHAFHGDWNYTISPASRRRHH